MTRRVVRAGPGAGDELLAARASGASVVVLDPRLGEPERRRRAAFASRSDDRPSAVVFTSGTTSRARAVVLPWDELDAAADAVIEATGLRAGDRWVCPLPSSHVGGLGVLLRCDRAGATAVLEPFDPPSLAARLAAGATHVSLVGRMLGRLLEEAPDLRAPALRVAMIGGGPTDPALIARARAAGIPAVTTYGLTEAGSTVTLGRLDAAPRTAGDAGWPVGGRELRIGAGGRIELRGRGLATRYEDDEGDGVGDGGAPLWRDGWLRGGDFGRLDPDGRLVVEDRRVDRIVTGGENVAPGAVEQVLRTAPGVHDVCVVGVPDPDWGQRVVAVVQWAEDARHDDLFACARADLMPWQRPKQVVDWEGELPRSELGKLLRRAVREKVLGAG